MRERQPAKFHAAPPATSADLQKKSVWRRWQSEISAERPTFVAASEEAAPLQFRHHPVDEVVEPFGEVGEHDVEAVAGLADQPFLHLIGDFRRRTDESKSAIAAKPLGELP